MRLSDLLEDSSGRYKDINITLMSADSREIKPGWLFAAFPGSHIDGRDFIPTAIENGAVAILTSHYDGNIPDHIALICSENPRRLFAHMAAKLHPDQPDIVVAVTGSNGKSSTVNFCRQLWQKLDYSAASLGTIGIEAPGILRKAAMTTPDPVTLHAELAELEKSGITHLAMESSSHGLDQYRLDGVKLKAAGFTNLSRDHLDYHGTMEDYLAAKLRLFSELLPETGIAVVNADTPEYKTISDICSRRGIRIIGYGRAGTEIKVLDRKILPEGQELRLKVLDENLDVILPLVGEFQTYNALCALGLVIATAPENTLRPYEAATWLEHLQGVRGRMERVGMLPNGATVYVDYAHTPDGLKTVLESLRPHVQNRLHVVFGCGGDRDRGKRPMMGEIAGRLADHAILTDDNPRTEDPAAIRADALQGSLNLVEIAGRRNAIEHGIASLEKGDILVIAGKGHEQGQIIGDQVLPFDDAAIAREIIGEYK